MYRVWSGSIVGRECGDHQIYRRPPSEFRSLASSSSPMAVRTDPLDCLSLAWDCAPMRPFFCITMGVLTFQSARRCSLPASS